MQPVLEGDCGTMAWSDGIGAAARRMRRSGRVLCGGFVQHASLQQVIEATIVFMRRRCAGANPTEETR